MRKFYNEMNKQQDLEHGKACCEAIKATIEQSSGEGAQQTEGDGNCPIVSVPVNTDDTLCSTTEKKHPKVDESPVPLQHSTPAGTESTAWTMTHSFYAIMGGYEFVNKDEVTVTSKRFQDGVIVSPEGLLSLKREPFMRSPPVHREDIEDKSKVSYTTKAFILFQGKLPTYARTCLGSWLTYSAALYFCIQCIARICQGLPTSLLEMSTFAHCVVALLVECFWFRKPLSIQLPSQIPVDREVFSSVKGEFLNNPRENIDGLADCSAIGFFSLLYGGLHLLAWNVAFPSQLERILWRIAAVSVTLTGPQIVICYILCEKFLWNWLSSETYKNFHGLLRLEPGQNRKTIQDELRKSLGDRNGRAPFQTTCAFFAVCFSCLILLIQALFRVFLLVECFVHLVYLPEAAFQVVQSLQYLPHIG